MMFVFVEVGRNIRNVVEDNLIINKRITLKSYPFIYNIILAKEYYKI